MLKKNMVLSEIPKELLKKYEQEMLILKHIIYLLLFRV